MRCIKRMRIVLVITALIVVASAAVPVVTSVVTSYDVPVVTAVVQLVDSFTGINAQAMTQEELWDLVVWFFMLRGIS